MRRVVHDERRLHVVDDGRALEARQPGVERHGNHPYARRCENGADVLGRRSQREHDSIANGHAGLSQRTCDPALLEFARRRGERR